MIKWGLSQGCKDGSRSVKLIWKATYWMREIFVSFVSGKGLIYKIYKEFVQHNIKNQTIQVKHGQRIWTGIFPDINDHQAHENVLNITHHQANAYQSHNEVSPHACWNGSYKKGQQITTPGEYVEKRKPLCTQGKCKFVQSLWKTIWRFLKSLKRELLHDSAIPTPGYLSEENKISNSKRQVHRNIHCRTIRTAKIQKQPKYHQQMNG